MVPEQEAHPGGSFDQSGISGSLWASHGPKQIASLQCL